MSVATGRWLAPLRALIDEFPRLSADQRAARLREEASSKGVTLAHLRRSLLAARYIEDKIAEGVIAREAAIASASAVERLIALERYSPADAAAVQVDVLTGKIGAVEALALVKRRGARQAFKVRTDYALAAAEQAFPTFSTFSTPSLPASPKRSLLGVDVEVDFDNGKKGAIFFPPSFHGALLRDRPFKELVLRAFSAIPCYDKVAVVVFEKEEYDNFVFLLTCLRQEFYPFIQGIDWSRDSNE